MDAEAANYDSGFYSTPAPSVTADSGECLILAGSTGKAVQAALAAVCIASLLCKYHRDPAGRSLGEFALDSSKQVCGASWIHVLNLLFATMLVKYENGGTECEWYWINIVVDCTLGVLVNYMLLKAGQNLAMSMLGEEEAVNYKTGEYKNSDGSLHTGKYFKQLAMWLCIVSIMKICMVIVMVMGHTTFLGIARTVLAPFSSNSTVELLVVMIVTPFFMNTLQLWVTDNFIRKQGAGGDMDGEVEFEGGMRTRIQHEGGL